METTASETSTPLAERPPVLPPGLLRRLRRPRSSAGPLLIFFALALAMMFPFFPAGFRGVGDLYAVIGSTVEAKAAMLEGQFPIRVPPNQLDDTRYPIFQYYGNFPYTLSGLIYLLIPTSAYNAWKLAAVLMMTLGAFYTYRFSFQLTRRTIASVVAGAVFVTSPYMFADLGARGAYTEFVAFNMMPIVMFYAWRAFVSPKKRYILLSAIAWTLLGLSHNISYLYGVIFGGLFFLSMIRLDARYGWRLLRVSLAGVLSVTMVLYYIVPQVMTLKDLMINVGKSNPFYWRYLTTLKNLLAPLAYTDPESTTANLALQVGLPMLILVPIALLSIFSPRMRRRDRWMVLRLFALFAIAFFLIWTPFNFWQYMPNMLLFVQFPYRLLLFLMMFGAVLSAYAIAFIGGRSAEGAGGGGARKWIAVASLGLVGFMVYTYTPGGRLYDAQTVPKQTKDPEMGGLEDYLLTTTAAARTGTYHPDINLAGWEFGLTKNGYHYRLPDSGWLVKPTTVEFPSPQEASTLVIEGELPDRDVFGNLIPDNVGQVEFVVRVGATRHAKAIQPGPFRIVAPLDAAPKGQPIQVTLDALVIDFARGHRNTMAKLNRIAFEPFTPAAEGRALLPAESMKRLMKYGKHSRLEFAVDRPALLQIPVIHYPKLLTVTLDGEKVDYGNLGRFVALPVEAGKHVVTVTFTGARWANWLSGIGWTIAVGGLVVLAIRHRFVTRRRARPVMESAGTGPGPIFGIRETGVAAAALIVGVAVAWGTPIVATYFDGKLRIKVTADSNYNDEQGVEFAFDGNRGTFWAAKGSTGAVVNILPSRPAQLEKIELEGRETGLMEQWRHVKVVMYRSGQRVYEQDCPIEDAERLKDHILSFPLHEADKIELHFSDAVLKTLDGRVVDRSAVSPGYREIKLTWANEVMGH